MPAVTNPSSPGDKKILFFDGVCNLCNTLVQFVLKHNRQQNICFAPLQGEAAASIANYRNGNKMPETVIFYDSGQLFFGPDAIFRLAGYLVFPYNLGRYFKVLPRRTSAWLYGQVARNRYRWFGRRDACMLPGPGMKDRFLT